MGLTCELYFVEIYLRMQKNYERKARMKIRNRKFARTNTVKLKFGINQYGLPTGIGVYNVNIFIRKIHVRHATLL